MSSKEQLSGALSKRLAIESGEDPFNNPIEYILGSIRTIYSVKHRNGAIRRVNVNIAATTVENYRKLKEAGIGTYILFQETYHKQSYEKLHPSGPKHDYAYHTEAMDRAMLGGIDDVGIGVLFGLERYRYEFAALLMHAEHLEAVHGVGPHTIRTPGEAGLYFFLGRSDKPAALPFQKWLAGEVLPSIRKTGGYQAKTAQGFPDAAKSLFSFINGIK